MARRIPLWGAGARVVAYALVDDADYDTIARHRWHVKSEAYRRENVPFAEPDPALAAVTHQTMTVY